MDDSYLSLLSKKELAVLKAILEGNRDSESIKKALNYSDVEVVKNLMFLENKGLIKRKEKKLHEIILTELGKKYLVDGFPEETIIKTLKESGELTFQELASKLKDILDAKELGAAIGRLKKAGILAIDQGKLKLVGDPGSLLNQLKQLKEQLVSITNRSFTEDEFSKISSIIEELKKRKCIEIRSKTIYEISLTEKGLEAAKQLSELDLENIIDKLTPEIIISGSWRGKKFRKYDVKSPVPKIFGGSFHHFRDFIEKIKEIMLSLGFKEVEGSWIETAFWNFDIMFQPQDHPAREQHDTFYLRGKGRLPRNVELAASVAYEHEQGYHYSWDHEVAKKLVLRTHTTAVSFRTMARMLLVPPVKYFAIGRVFRNEAVDATHLPEFHQVEGIVIDRDLTFRDLLGVIKEFYLKLGIRVRFMPSYFPYTEPSVQIMAYHEKIGKWVEMGGAGIFRKECLRPLKIEYPVLAFGLGLERLAMFFYELEDIRMVFGNLVDLDFIRRYKVKLW
jgi:phenylalanyl-tRNA synthetase alpha chain